MFVASGHPVGLWLAQCYVMVGAMLGDGWHKVGSCFVHGWCNVGSWLAQSWVMVGAMLGDGWCNVV